MYLDLTIKTFTLASLFLAISCKPMTSANSQKRVAKKKQTRIDNSNPQDQVYGSKLVYSRDTCSANNTQLFTSSVEIDSSASTVSLIKTMCAGSTAASMGIGEIRKIYRITNTQNKITSASYYQVVYKYTSENGKAAIQEQLPNGRVDTQNQTITDSRVGEAEEYTLNIRIENINDKTIKLEFIQGQEIVQDDILGGFFTR